jgi:hypothetical protein
LERAVDRRALPRGDQLIYPTVRHLRRGTIKGLLGRSGCRPSQGILHPDLVNKFLEPDGAAVGVGGCALERT